MIKAPIASHFVSFCGKVTSYAHNDIIAKEDGNKIGTT